MKKGKDLVGTWLMGFEDDGQPSGYVHFYDFDDEFSEVKLTSVGFGKFEYELSAYKPDIIERYFEPEIKNGTFKEATEDECLNALIDAGYNFLSSLFGEVDRNHYKNQIGNHIKANEANSIRYDCCQIVRIRNRVVK